MKQQFIQPINPIRLYISQYHRPFFFFCLFALAEIGALELPAVFSSGGNGSNLDLPLVKIAGST